MLASADVDLGKIPRCPFCGCAVHRLFRKKGFEYSFDAYYPCGLTGTLVVWPMDGQLYRLVGRTGFCRERKS